MSMFGHYGAGASGSPGAPRARRKLPLACALLLVACAEAGQRRSLGADLGTFGVEATEAANDCGPGALGSTPRWSFDVELARADTELFWAGNVGGHVGADLAFDVSADARFELRPPRAEDPGCAVGRQDSISGVLLADGSGAITAFTAQMLFVFAAEPDAACTPRELGEAGVPDLPCSMSYALEGQRTRAPAP